MTFLQMELDIEDDDASTPDSRYGLFWILTGIQSALQYAEHQIEERDKRRAT